MTRTLAIFALIMLACVYAQAATLNTVITGTASGPISGTTSTLNGTVTLSNVGTGTMTVNVNLVNSTGSFVLTVTTGMTGTLTGNLTGTANLVAGTGTGAATITGGTGNFAGATGSFPSLNGTGSFAGTTVTVNFSGAGTISTGGSGGPPVPTITAVWDSASNTTTLAQGSIFIVKGSNLCPSGVKLFGIPRPTVSPDGVKITFTANPGGTATDAILVYTYNPSGVCQLAGILPSTVATGNYNVTVTNGTTSAPVQTKVVQTKFALFTQDSSGTGLASVQNYISASQVDLNSFTTGNAKATTISPGHPLQYMIAYGTGMGALVGGDNSASPAFDFSTHGTIVNAIVGGVTIPALYAGRAGYAGEDQINFQLPANVPTGCAVSFQMSVNGQLSNTTFIAIAPDANATACVQPGFTTAQLQQFDNGASRTLGVFSLTQFSVNVPQSGTVKIDNASGGFTRYTGYQLARLAGSQAQFTVSGSCIVTHVQSGGQAGLTPNPVGGLDAGTVTLNGPAGSGLTNQPFTQDPDSFQYSLLLGTEGITIPGGLNAKLVAGTYAVAGAGGADVGKFNTQITLGAPLNLIGGLPSTVNRSAGLTLNWTGGNPSDLVEIFGSSRTTSGSGASAITDVWSFICTTTAGVGTFTVPSSILLQLPAVSASSASGGGFLEFASAVTPSTFTAPLTAGGAIDNGTFLALVGFGATVSYQ
ncbi:MAG TPA: hypothetical protein VEU96_03930 [Bryobacteraceae bacterium]|nr:hypothetical protein [Bryobacteraceae bacterium]